MNDVEVAFRDFHSAPNSRTLLNLLRRCQRPVYNLCYQALGHPQDAEDAAQEALLEIAQGAAQLREVRAFRRWIYRVTVNTAIDHRMKRARRAARENERLASVKPSPDPSQAELREALTTALAKLDDELRCLVVEHYFEKATLEELGRRHGCSPNAVWKRIERAKERLKQSLAGAGLAVAVPRVDGALESILPVEVAPNLILEAVVAKVSMATLAGGIIVGTKTALSAATIVTGMICLFLGTAGGMLIQSRRSESAAPAKDVHVKPTVSDRAPQALEKRVREMEQQLLLKEEELARTRAELKAASEAGIVPADKERTAKPPSKESLAHRLVKVLNKLRGRHVDTLPQDERISVTRDAAEFTNFLIGLEAMDPKNPLALLQKAEGRTYLTEFLDALCSDGGNPLNDAQRHAVRNLLDQAAHEFASMNNPSPLEIHVVKGRLETRIQDQLQTLLAPDQFKAVSKEYETWSLFPGGPKSVSETGVGGATTPAEAAVQVSQYWSSNLRVSENQVSVLANQFATDYAQMNRELEWRHGAQAVQDYYNHVPSGTETQRNAYSNIELSILELQLKYEKALLQTLGPDREAAIQDMSTTLVRIGNLR